MDVCYCMHSGSGTTHIDMPFPYCSRSQLQRVDRPPLYVYEICYRLEYCTGTLFELVLMRTPRAALTQVMGAESCRKRPGAEFFAKVFSTVLAGPGHT